MSLSQLELDESARMSKLRTKMADALAAHTAIALLVVGVWLTIVPFMQADSTIDRQVLIGYVFYAVGLIAMCVWAKITPIYERTLYHRIAMVVMGILAATGMVTLAWFVHGVPFANMG